MIVLLTEEGEPTSNYLEERIIEKQTSYQRINVENFDGRNFSFQVNQTETRVGNPDVQVVTGVFIKYHRTIASKKIAEIPDQYQRFVSLETKDTLLGAFLNTNAVFMNPPESSFASTIKISQLSLARKAGFKIPDTIISANAKELTDFWQKKNGIVISKAVHQGWVANNEQEDHVIFTNLVTQNSLIALNEANFPPLLFQEAIKKVGDIRVVVVGQSCFASLIESGSIDWRTDGQSITNSKVYALPEDIGKKCIEIVKQMHLALGVLDLVIREDGEIFFLEVNQQGGWLWMEKQLGLPIREAVIARLLGE